jgi:AcrR family transcriptional regulator
VAIATEMFAERGFHGVSLAQIAAALGYSKQAVLHYFPSKETLYGEVLAGIATQLEAIVAEARDMDVSPESKLKQVFLCLQPDDKASQLRLRLLVRELMDVEARGKNPRTWYLRHFLDGLRAIGRDVDAWAAKSDDEVFALLYQLIGAVSYFAISTSTLAGMYGPRSIAAITAAFPTQLETLIDGAMRTCPQR